MNAPKNSRESSTRGSDAVNQTGQRGHREEPARERTEENEDEKRRDEKVKEEPEHRIDDRGVVIDRGINVVTLKPRKNREEDREGEIEEDDGTRKAHFKQGVKGWERASEQAAEIGGEFRCKFPLSKCIFRANCPPLQTYQI